MALYTEQTARANVRNRDGKRVFYLADEDKLTPAAREWLRAEHIALLPAQQAKPTQYQTLFGAVLTEKPEHMTHLCGNTLVFKDHPRIAFRGAVDLLEAELLLCQCAAQAAQQEALALDLKEILDFTRALIRADVLDEPCPPAVLCGLTEDELRAHSHFPQKYYNQPHFMPEAGDGALLLQLNRVRAVVRQTELACYRAFRDENGLPTRSDLVLALNRMSSLIWILMIRLKAKEEGVWSSPHKSPRG